jgi:hypothetical protein
MAQLIGALLVVTAIVTLWQWRKTHRGGAPEVTPITANATRKEPAAVGDKGPLWKRIAPITVSLTSFAVAWYLAKEAVIYLRAPTPAQTESAINLRLMQAIPAIKSTLPRQLDISTTLTDVRVEGTNMIYVNTITYGYALKDIKSVEELVRPKVCSSDMIQSIKKGASYTYEYWNSEPDRRFLGKFQISSCP